jgi:hypothetical protein
MQFAPDRNSDLGRKQYSGLWRRTTGTTRAARAARAARTTRTTGTTRTARAARTARTTGTARTSGRGTASGHGRSLYRPGLGGELHHNALHAAYKNHLALYVAGGVNGALIAADQAALLNAEGKLSVLDLCRLQEWDRCPLAGSDIYACGLSFKVDGGLTLCAGRVL